MGGIKDYSPAHAGRMRIDAKGACRRPQSSSLPQPAGVRTAVRVNRIVDWSLSDWVLPLFGLCIGVYLMIALGPLGIAVGLLLIIALFTTALQSSMKTVCAHCGYVLRSHNARICLCCKTELDSRSA